MATDPAARRALPTRLAGLVVALAIAAAPHGVYSGVITVGRGAAGVTLGMTRTQVVARLGRPYSANPPWLMEYARHAMFDVYLRSGRVRMLGIAAGSRGRFRLADGNRVFERGGVARLMRHYGRRLKPLRVEQTGEPVYRITGRLQGRTTWTDFFVNHFGSNALVRDVFILFP